jgi:hypothetical protein
MMAKQQGEKTHEIFRNNAVHSDFGAVGGGSAIG